MYRGEVVMSECKQWESRIRAFLAGELPPAEQARLLEHARSCAACGAVLELHRRLEDTAAAPPSPSETEFRAMRRAVLDRLEPAAASASRPSLWRDLAALFRAHPALAAGVAAVLLAAVFLTGRWSARPAAGLEDQLLGAIQAQARQEQSLAGYWDSPFVYSNVTFRPGPAGRLALSFDVTRHVSLVTAEDSPVAREVMVHAILDSSSLCPRLKAISLSEGVADERLKEALIFALHNDPSLAVRRKALAVLVRYPADPDVEAALLKTLRNDEAVQLRLEALDGLAERQADPAAIRRALPTGERPGDAAVRQEAARRLSM
jgi:hypothetical protein